MRTTLVIDDEVYQAARSLADAREVSIGRVLSELARRGLDAENRIELDDGDTLPVFRVPAGSRPITLDDVKKIEDEA